MNILAVVEALQQLGFVVDAIDIFDVDTVPRTIDYDLLVGEFDNMERLASHVRRGGYKVFLGTRPYWRCELEAVRRRVDYLERTRGIRFEVPPWERGESNTAADIADAIVAYSTDSYTELLKPMTQISNSYLPHCPIAEWSAKQWDISRHHFLWAGTGSFVRKGLDLVLEAFAKTPEKHLWVCGPLHWKDHHDFLETFRRELFYTSNIHPVGFVGVSSTVWHTLTRHCGFFVLPSCAEGMCGAVLNAMASGVVPLVTSATNVPIGTAGFSIRECTVQAVCDAITWTADLSLEEFQCMARDAELLARKGHTLATFSAACKDLFRDFFPIHSTSHA